ncbi:MAG TPA: PDZ domain-containing protein, partial [Pirellulales bacterium]|nr:PDZ domain-containing protein [Pirellulales bacterium]
VTRPLPTAARFGLIFSPDSRMLIAADDTVGWWNASTGKPIAVADAKLSGAGPLSISSDGLTLAVGRQRGEYSDASFSVFRMNPDAREVTTLQDKHSAGMGSTRALALTPDGKSLAVSQYFSGNVALFDTTTGRRLNDKFFDHASSVSAIGFNAEGDSMVTASVDGSIKVWTDYKTQHDSAPGGKTTAPQTTALTGHTGQVTCAGFTADGKQVISSSNDKTSRIWNLTQATASLHQAIEGIGGMRARFSPDGLLMALAEPGNPRLRDAATGRPVREFLRPHNQHPQIFPDSVAFSPDSRLLAVGYGGAKDVSHVELWDIDGGERLADLPGTTDIPNFTTDEFSGIVAALAFSPDGRFLAAGFGSLNSFSSGNQGPHPLKVYDVAARRTVRVLEGHEHYCPAIAFSRDGGLMASASYDGTARIWYTATWKTRHVLSNPDPSTTIGWRRVFDVAFSPTAELLAMASHEGNVHIWNAATGQLVQTLRGHANGVWCVAFSPDGRTLASGSYDNTVRLWNVATWRELVRLDPGQGFFPCALDFSSDGARLLAAAYPAILWSTQADDATPTERLAEQLTQGPNQTTLDLGLGTFDFFLSRVRMLSETPRLDEALELVLRERPDDVRVLAALAAARANRHAARQEWQSAVEQFDILKRLGREIQSPKSKVQSPNETTLDLGLGTLDYFRTPGLLRLATALFHEDRPAEAAMLLAAGEERRAEDETWSVGFGIPFHAGDGKATKVFHGSPAWRAGLREGDRILKLNDAEVAAENAAKLSALLAGDGPVRFTFEHPEGGAPQTVELTKAGYLQDDVANLLSQELLAAVDQKLAESLRHPGLLELRAELAGLSSDHPRQVAGYTAAIEALSVGNALRGVPSTGERSSIGAPRNGTESVPYRDLANSPRNDAADDKLAAESVRIPAADLQRLHCRRGNAYLALKQWQQAADDYAQGLTNEIADEALLENQALAQAEVMLAPGKWAVRKPVEAKSDLGAYQERERLAASKIADPWLMLAAAYRIQNDQAAVDQLVERRPQIAGAVGDLFAQGENADWGRAIEIYNKGLSWVDTQLGKGEVVKPPPYPRVRAGLGRPPHGLEADLLSHRARASERLGDWTAAAADWQRVAARGLAAANLLTDFADRLLKAAQAELAARMRQRARELLEAALEVDPDDEPALAALADMLLDMSGPRPLSWTPLKRAALKTQLGATLIQQTDGSLLLQRGSETVILPDATHSIAAIRVETSADAAAPDRGATFTEHQIVSTRQPANVDSIAQLEIPPAAKVVRVETTAASTADQTKSAAFNEYRAIALDAQLSESGAPVGRFVRLDLV